MGNTAKSPLIVIFTTVMVDLIGFGMIIPLISLYGRHFGANGLELAILGGIYSLMQFFFAPVWGSLSDRLGRRPIILMSLLGSTLSYLIFALAPTYLWLVVARGFAGIFAANISAAQAYIADITRPEERARGMGLIGAAFGIGFTLGPPLGGIASAKLGLGAPGLIASTICGINFLLALWRLPESLSPENRNKAIQRTTRRRPLRLDVLLDALKRGQLGFFLFTFFFVTFAFTTMEQTFSLLFQTKFFLETGEAGYKTGLVLMSAGVVGALIQGGMIRSLVRRYGEWSLLIAGLALNTLSMAVLPYGPTYSSYFILTMPLAFGSALINPSLSALISKNARADEQGSIMGLSQGLGSLARATGPFVGLLTFAISPKLTYLIATLMTLGLLGFNWTARRKHA